MNLYQALAGLALGYVLGAIPCGMIVARVYRGVDLTSQGSGKTGSTNVLRTLGPGAAAVAFAGDVLKGVVAVVLASHIGSPDPVWPEMLAAFGAVAGHTYSPFLGFKGGRGVATGLGATATAAPLQIGIALLIATILVAATRYVSLGSVVGSILAGLLLVVLALQTGISAWAFWGVCVGGFILIAHRDNIQRLRTGTERKIGERH